MSVQKSIFIEARRNALRLYNIFHLSDVRGGL